MTASIHDLGTWFITAEQQKATHMIIITDTYDYENYPVYVSEDEDVNEVLESKRGNMRKVEEVYKISLGWESQSKERRSYHL